MPAAAPSQAARRAARSTPRRPMAIATDFDPTATVPDASGRFGRFGGRYVPETLVSALKELDVAYKEAFADPEFMVRGRGAWWGAWEEGRRWRGVGHRAPTGTAPRDDPPRLGRASAVLSRAMHGGVGRLRVLGVDWRAAWRTGRNARARGAPRAACGVLRATRSERRGGVRRGAAEVRKGGAYETPPCTGGSTLGAALPSPLGVASAVVAPPRG